MAQSTDIHPTAVVENGAVLGADVSVGPFSVVGANARVGAGTQIGSHCLIGEGDHGPLHIGAGALIRSHSVLYSGSTYGERLETGHQVVLREGMTIGRNLRIGTYGDLQGHLEIGDYVRFHSGAFVPARTTIEDFVWVFPHVTFTNDPHPPSDECTLGATIERGAVLGARSVLLPGVRVGAGALVAAGAVVTKDVAPGRVVVGAPARDRGPVEDVGCHDGRLAQPYPWWGHFSRGYGDDVTFEETGPMVSK